MRPVFIFLRQTFQRNSPNNYPITRRSFATTKSTTQVGGTLDESDLRKARKWLADFNINSIPRSICAVSFSRSSGPGGQNVNKVNSKATLRVPLSALLPLVPTILHQDLRTSRYVADRSDALVIQSEESRKQSSNVDSCYEKLYKVIQESAQNVIPGETSAEQRTRVRNLKAADTEARLKSKKMHSAKKSNRRKSNDD